MAEKQQALHKGYLWALAVVVLGGAWFYFSDETRSFSGQQKFYFWALQDQSTPQVRKLANQYTVQELEQLCRNASEKNDGYLSGTFTDKKPGLISGAMQNVTTDICNAYIYRLKLSKIQNEEFDDLTF